MVAYILKNFDMLDARAKALRTGFQVLVEDKQIRRVSDGEISAPGAVEIDLGGRVLMPGLIDCHVHVNRWILPQHPVVLPSLMTATAGNTLKGMLMRGFTTVRDAGGADAGHRQAVELGLFVGPRLFVSGRAISQTGGHGDPRSTAQLAPLCQCVHLEGGLARIADGISEVRKAVRDEIRLGADQIKVMAGGGVASPADPIDQLQYSMEELVAVCDEARRSHKDVMAHVFTDEGIRRCIEAGVRFIEHGFFLSESTARVMVEKDIFLSPNLLTPRIILEQGRELNYPEVSLGKAKEVVEEVVKALDVAQRAGVKVCFSSDLSKVPERASEEFLVRNEIQDPRDIIYSATVIGADALRMVGKIGEIVEGAFADLLAIDGNPFEDISLLTEQGRWMPLIMKEGTIYKNTLQ